MGACSMSTRVENEGLMKNYCGLSLVLTNPLRQVNECVLFL